MSRISALAKYRWMSRIIISRQRKSRHWLPSHGISNSIDSSNTGRSRKLTSRHGEWVCPCRSTGSAFAIPTIVQSKSRFNPSWRTIQRVGSCGNSSRRRSIWWRSAPSEQGLDFRVLLFGRLSQCSASKNAVSNFCGSLRLPTLHINNYHRGV